MQESVEAKRFDPASYESFRFGTPTLSREGLVRLPYSLGPDLDFVEEFELPMPDAAAGGGPGAGGGLAVGSGTVQRLLRLLHLTAGVSYYKTAAPPRVEFEGDPPPPATAELLEALYSEGLGEFAYTNRLASLPRPRFASGPAPDDPGEAPEGRRVLVPVGGGKDSVVALEIVRRSLLGERMTLFHIGDAAAIRRTVAASGLPALQVRRRLDPQLKALNEAGALNGHVPITAVVSCVALLTAALNGFSDVALANERSASSGNLQWDGIDVNHQFSKSARAETLMQAALAELNPALRIYSVLRPASELGIARAFAKLEQYHGAFTSCNTIFRLDPELRGASWCGDCPKCRFVALILAPFLPPEKLEAIFGKAMFDDLSQYEGFALLTATGGHKPFECVGEEEESLAAIRLLAADPAWKDRPVVARLIDEVLLPADPGRGDPAAAFALADAPALPEEIRKEVDALLGA